MKNGERIAEAGLVRCAADGAYGQGFISLAFGPLSYNHDVRNPTARGVEVGSLGYIVKTRESVYVLWG